MKESFMTIRLKEKEKEEIKRRAASKEMSVSKFVRQVLLNPDPDNYEKSEILGLIDKLKKTFLEEEV
jgi:uncharacterized protein (DUF1778 family)